MFNYFKACPNYQKENVPPMNRTTCQSGNMTLLPRRSANVASEINLKNLLPTAMKHARNSFPFQKNTIKDAPHVTTIICPLT